MSNFRPPNPYHPFYLPPPSLPPVSTITPSLPPASLITPAPSLQFSVTTHSLTSESESVVTMADSMQDAASTTSRQPPLPADLPPPLPLSSNIIQDNAVSSTAPLTNPTALTNHVHLHQLRSPLTTPVRPDTANTMQNVLPIETTPMHNIQPAETTFAHNAQPFQFSSSAVHTATQKPTALAASRANASNSPALSQDTPRQGQTRTTEQQLATLIPPERAFTWQQFLSRPKRSTFTQEDMDNFARLNPSTIGKNTVDRFAEHMYQLIAADSSEDARPEADALSLLTRNIDHRTLANLLQIYMDMSCEISVERTRFWRHMKLHYFDRWRHQAPARNNLPNVLSQMTAFMNRNMNTNNNTNTNRNSNFSSNNFRNNNFRNNNSNFNTNRQFNNNFNSNRNSSFNRNNNNRQAYRVRYNNQNNFRQNNNNQQQHTSVQNSNFNTNRNNNNNSNSNTRNNNGSNNQRPNNNNNRFNSNNRNNNSNTFRNNAVTFEPLTEEEMILHQNGTLNDDDEIVWGPPLNDDQDNDDDGQDGDNGDDGQLDGAMENDTPF